MNTELLFSAESVEWYTPTWLVQALADATGGPFDLDPCGALGSNTRLIIPAVYTLPDHDGLKAPWFGRVFCNPPYSGTADWLAKGAAELAAGHIRRAVYLVPARTDTKWWHTYAEPARAAHDGVTFIPGRVRFGYPEHTDKKGRHWPAAPEGHSKRPAGFPSAVVVMG
jgi:phage N-6-adenine-methyltransferase